MTGTEWSEESKHCLVIICTWVLDQLRSMGLIHTGWQLTSRGSAYVGNAEALAKILSQGVLTQCLVNMRVAPNNVCEDIALLARYKGLIADLDDGFDLDLVDKLYKQCETLKD